MLNVADGFSEGANAALRYLSSTEGIATVQDILAGAGNMAANFGAAIGNLVPGLTALAGSASRVFAPLTDGIAESARKLSDSLRAAAEDGSLDDFFRRAIETAKQFGAVLSSVGGIIGGVFNAASAAGGGNILGGMADSLAKVREWVNSFEGQSALTTFFQSAQAAMGAVLPVVLQVAQVIGSTLAPILADVAQKIGPMLGPAVQKVGDALRTLSPVVSTVAGWIGKLVGWITPLVPALVGMAAVILPVVGALKAWAVVQGVLNTLMAMNPIGLIVVAIAALVAGLVVAYKNSETFRDVVSKAWAAVKLAFEVAWTAIKAIFGWLVDQFRNAWDRAVAMKDGIVGAWNLLKDAASAVVSWLGDKWNSFIETMKSIPGKVKAGLSGMWDGLRDGLKSAVNWCVDKLNWLIGKLNGVTSKIPGIGSVVKVPELPHLSAGGRAGIGGDGVLYGPGQAGRDSILATYGGIPTAVVAPGEYVTDADTTRRFLPLLQSLPHLAGGGQVGVSDSIIAAAKTYDPNIDVTSTVRSGDPGYHGIGKAVDFAPSQGLAEFFYSRYRDQLAQIIWNPGPVWFNVRRDEVGTGTASDKSGDEARAIYGPGTMAGHGDHLHVAASDPVKIKGAESAASGSAAGTSTSATDSGTSTAAQDTGNGTSTSTDSKAPDAGSINTTGLSVDGGANRLGTLLGDAVLPKDSISAAGKSMGLPEYNGPAPSEFLGKGLGTIASGVLAFFGLEQSILSSSNVYNKALQDGVAEGWRAWGPRKSEDKSADKSDSKATDSSAAAASPTADTARPTRVGIPLVQNSDGTWTSSNPEWAKLIRRESGGNATITQGVSDSNSANGDLATGLFQITGGTWKLYGGTEYAPSAREATPQQQAEIAAKIFRANNGRDWGVGLAGRENADKLRAGLYDSGGILEPGVTLAQNDTGKPEAILTAPQWRTAQAAIDLAQTRPDPRRIVPAPGQVEEVDPRPEFGVIERQAPAPIGVGGEGANTSVSGAIASGLGQYAQSVTSQATSALATAGSAAAGPAGLVGPGAAAAQGLVGLGSNLASKFAPKVFSSLGGSLGLDGRQSTNLFQSLNANRTNPALLQGVKPKASTGPTTSNSSSDVNINGDVRVLDSDAFVDRIDRERQVRSQAALVTAPRV
ncbi:hypothetical protein AXK57_16000 [Tsukamurella pulmonis]|uniref:transglycosylase family protein n=1 Tax=Tsukamurella pulmonis TaxID=47312 RepID=UPI000797408B|nr:transglycosylase family protein [Tsukamurella pulmonis]KXP08669.1 hypothetical protein AXK57_16000 [Tsukamurella pulmonis]